jgi:L-lysine exporter family protein LysE/ArgO
MLDPLCYRVATARDPFGRSPVVVGRPVALALDAVIAMAVIGAIAGAHLGGGVLGFFAIGVGIGIATCIPIGIANVIVIDAAYRYGRRRALGASIGGAIADGIYAALGIFGVGPLIASYPVLPYILHAISGCVLVGYGVVLVRSQPALAGLPDDRVTDSGGGQLGAGIVVGLAATLFNPSAVVTWVVIVGSYAAGTTGVEAGAWLAGIVIGTFVWFQVVASLALRGRRVLRDKAIWMTRIVGAIVVASGLFSLARVVGLAS